MSSVEPDAKRGSMKTDLLREPSNPDSKTGTPSTTIQKDQSDQKATNSLAEATNHGKKTETPEKVHVRTFLARSFRALRSALGLSMISRSINGNSNIRSDENAGTADQKDDKRDPEWADVVDNVIESDNENESVDSYIEFMRHRKSRSRGDGTNGGKFGLAKKKLDQQGEEEVVQDEERKDDIPNDDFSEIERSMPWLGCNFGSGS